MESPFDEEVVGSRFSIVGARDLLTDLEFFPDEVVTFTGEGTSRP